MRLLILGGSGMLGHQLWRGLHAQHDTWVTLRRPVADFAVHNLFDEAKAIQFDDITDDTALERALGQAKPEAVINCVGLIKQRDEASDEALTLRVNAEFPHRLAKRCGEAGARLIHFSTDCIFAGTKGNYTESDPPDAADLYGQSKHQGEVADAHSVTLRTSVIGHELATNLALLDWFLSQRGQAIRGFTKAIYSGFTTLEMARIADRILTQHTDLSGVWHVASEPISKFGLLELCREKLGWEGVIEPNDEFVCDRSLNADRFNAATGYTPPSWEAMIGELAQQS
ncbi:MAG: SDR family oxidoreductase [Verrucomicrobia bacterium]|nr:SDR family oxidoreductase [Verrucomicrobiota bacterium]MBT4227313.1 SDR family oxidoreductase [Verrucomicrobiota bacterium]MBT7734808.1 SDR family oxidoreductase [Verrucomicrobiota bacterium]